MAEINNLFAQVDDKRRVSDTITLHVLDFILSPFSQMVILDH
ncbi:MAG: hypothetical protein OEZ39_20490 [Gammaproteobacteria bacterium]|nr:hypothetical protein [Gammaproteobacteria bacterium]